MKFDRRVDILLNVILPLSLGLFIYWSAQRISIPAVLKNYLPDGCWAYAFISSILIIWDRKVNIRWITPVFLLSACFELLQYRHLIPGTGDVKDVAVYFLFFSIALILNQIFRTLSH
ncbi:hypothetical protein [Dinghuibacter silviterrae]|uniref:VanZ-like domain-containing protein n=1 Tax=Dinghuibacter silviterrae TaxID=1539049 RepID=A0A4R8DE78_9BACT|nr:hypothetical protein [Dinghuibacter silviterrae]TDW95833.1 hypothetical protein EDB95_3647 [Dinghuibacter silviterrae]